MLAKAEPPRGAGEVQCAGAVQARQRNYPKFNHWTIRDYNTAHVSVMYM